LIKLVAGKHPKHNEDVEEQDNDHSQSKIG
jgi:hypothetical protein